MHLRYGTNPHQHATAAPVDGDRWPVRTLNGSPSYINMLDALNAWQLVREASSTLAKPVAASFKHVSPAGAAVAGPIDEVITDLYRVGAVGAVTSAYLRARDADPKCSYGDLAAVSGPVDAELADVLGRVVCDGIVAPGFHPGVVGALSRKQGGRFLVIEADVDFTPPAQETREVWGVRLTQERDTAPISAALLAETADVTGGELTASTIDDLLLGLVVLRYTQSNSVCYLRDGVTLGIGAGQQSRVDCTRLAGSKVDTWWLRRHPRVRRLRFGPELRRQDRINAQIDFIDAHLSDEERADWLGQLSGVAFASDGLLPFRDNVDQAARHGVAAIVEPGASVRRPSDIEAACREHGIVLARTGLRLFHH